MAATRNAIDVFYPILPDLGWIEKLVPLGIIRNLSGSGSLGLMTDIMKTHGPDSFLGRLSGALMGSHETTFYVLAVYLGAVGITRTKYLVPVCLIADGLGMIIAAIVVKLMF